MKSLGSTVEEVLSNWKTARGAGTAAVYARIIGEPGEYFYAFGQMQKVMLVKGMASYRAVTPEEYLSVLDAIAKGMLHITAKTPLGLGQRYRPQQTIEVLHAATGRGRDEEGSA